MISVGADIFLINVELNELMVELLLRLVILFSLEKLLYGSFLAIFLPNKLSIPLLEFSSTRMLFALKFNERFEDSKLKS